MKNSSVLDALFNRGLCDSLFATSVKWESHSAYLTLYISHISHIVLREVNMTLPIRH